MKLYFVCFYMRSGGPECIHQVCDMANQLGYDAYVVYFPTGVENLYQDKYQHIKLSQSIENTSDSVVFLPETFHIDGFKMQQDLQNPKYVMWWLSYDAGAEVLFDNNKCGSSNFNAFQSCYAKDKVTRELANISINRDATSFYLCDYIHPQFHMYGWNAADKMNTIAYNPAKDHITPEFCKAYNIPYVPLANMSREDIIATMQKCKVYIDCGFHPGRDRMPREAALLGCIVITNTVGSAAYYGDVPIIQKCETQAELYAAVQEAFSDYEAIVATQHHYRECIKNEITILQEQLVNAVKILGATPIPN